MKAIQTGALIALMLSSQLGLAKDWDFDVYLDNTKIGRHQFNLSDSNVLTSTAKFNVKVLFINAYQYDHKAVETWQDGCLNSLEAHTTENKVVTVVSGNLVEPNFLVENGKASYKLPACSMTFAYWNPKILSQDKLLNPQNAEWLTTKVSKLNIETIEIKGKNVEASHYKLDGALDGKNKLKIELWYNANNDWVALKSITPEGYIINYKLR